MFPNNNYESYRIDAQPGLYLIATEVETEYVCPVSDAHLLYAAIFNSRLLLMYNPIVGHKAISHLSIGWNSSSIVKRDGADSLCLHSSKLSLHLLYVIASDYHIDITSMRWPYSSTF